MLEKIAGLALVNKLRATLLMEADRNMHNKIIFDKRMLDSARAGCMIPDKQFSNKKKDCRRWEILKCSSVRPLQAEKA